MKIRRPVHLKATSRKNTQTTEEENILCALELRISVKNIGRAKFNSKMINNPVGKKKGGKALPRISEQRKHKHSARALGGCCPH